MTPRLEPILTPLFEQLGGHSLGDDSCLISKLWLFVFFKRRKKKLYLHIKDPPRQGQFLPQGFYLNKLGRHSLEDSCEV
jgi:hypothetical protein